MQMCIQPMQSLCCAPELPMDGYCTGATPEAGRPAWDAGLAADWLEWAVLGVLWGELWKALPAMRRMAAPSGCSNTCDATSRSYSACSRRAISSSAVNPAQQQHYVRRTPCLHRRHKPRKLLEHWEHGQDDTHTTCRATLMLCAEQHQRCRQSNPGVMGAV